MEIMLVTEYIVLFTRLADIDQMIGHKMTVDMVVGEIFPCPDIHAPIDLTRVGADDLRLQTVCQQRGKVSLSRSRRSEDRDQF